MAAAHFLFITRAHDMKILNLTRHSTDVPWLGVCGQDWHHVSVSGVRPFTLEELTRVAYIKSAMATDMDIKSHVTALKTAIIDHDVDIVIVGQDCDLVNHIKKWGACPMAPVLEERMVESDLTPAEWDGGVMHTQTGATLVVRGAQQFIVDLDEL